MCKISFTGGEGGVHPLCRGPCVGRVHPHIGKRAVPSRSCMAVRSCSVSPLRWGGTAFRRTDASIEDNLPVAGTDGITEWEALMKKQTPRRSRSNSPPPSLSEHASRLRARTVMRQRTPASISPPPAPTCTPTPTPIITPSQTPPSNTPTPTPPRMTTRPAGSRGTLSSASSSASTITFPPARLEPCWGKAVGKGRGGEAATEGLRVDTCLPPVPAFSSRFTPACAAATPVAAAAAAAATAVETAASAAAAAAAVCGAAAWEKGGSPSDENRAGPFAGQGMPFSGGAAASGETGSRAAGAADCGRRAGGNESSRPVNGEEHFQQDTACDRAVASMESEVAGMFDESRGMLGLSRQGLGDERVPALSLEELKDAYRGGRASLTSWTTAGVFNGGRKTPADASLVEVEQGRLGVLSSTDVYLFHFKETKPPSPSGSTLGEDAHHPHAAMHVVYLWFGREAGTEACLAARAQGKRLLGQQSSPASRTPLLEVEQGCEPALFLALFSYMLPPLVAVVLQGQNDTPNLRVLELQESPCLQGSGIVIAVEGPSSATLLAKHGPLPDRSYICLVRPRRSRGGSANERGGTFDEGYYWHGVGETLAVEEVGILLCQQVDRMFPSPSITDGGKRKGCGRKRRGAGAGGFGGGMMRGYVADVKVGLPVPEGFWACVLPERSVTSSFFASGGRWLPLQDLRPERRSRPVRVFGICAGSQNARRSFVSEVTTGGMPSQMRLSPSLSHVVDAGGSHVYVWHGNGSSSDGRRLACRVASSYAARCGASVEEVDAGSEPVGLLDCFIGWDEALVEPPPMLFLSPGRRPSQLGSNADLSPRTTPSRTVTCRGGRSTTGRTTSSGSTSSSLGPRLTPPGQRTPPFSVNSPPPLKQRAGGVRTPPRRRAVGAAAAAAVKGSPSGSLQGYSTRPRRNPHPVAQRSVPRYLYGGGCSDGGVDDDDDDDVAFVSPPPLPGPTPCTDALDPDRATGPSGPSGAVSPTSGTGGKSSDGRVRPDDEPSSSSGAVGASSETDSGGRALAAFDRGGGGKCEAGFKSDEHSRGAGLKCAGGKGQCGAGSDDNQRQHSHSGGAGREDSDRGGEDKNGDSGGREGNEGGHDRMGGGCGGGAGGGSGDDDGHGFRGARNGGESSAVDNEQREDGHDRDGEESEESDADEESDTFLRLSDVQFCEPVGVRRNAGATAELSSTCSDAPDASNGSRTSGGDIETRSVLSRHLSDFFRSPLDSTSKQRFSSIQSIYDARAGPRSFDSVKSGAPDDNASSRTRGSGSLFSSDEEHLTAFSGAIGNAVDIPASVMINFASSPRYSAPSPADLVLGLSDLVGSVSLPRTLDTKGSMAEDEAELVAESSEPAAEAAVPRRVITRESQTSTAPAAACELGRTEKPEEKQKAGLASYGEGSDSGDEDGGGAESEEEWLSHSIGDASATSELEERSDSSVAAAARPPQANPDRNHGGVGRAGQSDVREVTTGTPLSNKEQTGGKGGGDDPAAVVGDDWAGLNEDGSWRTEYARRAAGEAGAVEAERRRLAKVKADESWRSDAGKGGGTGCHGQGAQDARRESRSFTRLTGNVRDKLSVFEGALSSKAAKETTGNRSSVGALHGRGIVSAWAKKSTNCTTSVATTQEENGDTSPASGLAGGRRRRRPSLMEDPDEQDGEFLWKAGPAPCRLKGRPSLNLIRNGQVRIMSKALLMSCPERGDDDHEAGSRNQVNTKIATTSSVESSEEPPAQSKPSSLPAPQPTPPRVPRSPLQARTSPGGAIATVSRCPHPEQQNPKGSGSAERPASPKGNFWLAKAGLTRKSTDDASAASASAQATPPKDGSAAWRKAGETFTSPVAKTIGRVAAGLAAASRVNDATDASRQGRHGGGAAATSGRVWAMLRHRLDEEKKSVDEEGRPETMSPGVSSG